MGSSLGGGWIAANVFVATATGLCVWLTVSSVGGDHGADTIHVVTAGFVLWGLFWLWLAVCADHPAEDWRLHSPIAIAAAAGVVLTAHGFALLLLDARHDPHDVGRDIVITLCPLAILVLAVIVEVCRIRRDRLEAGDLEERLGIHPYR